MRYMFKILIMGDTDLILEYTTRALLDSGEYKETYYEWYKEISILDNTCDLEINVITDIISADYDNIIPTVDGIIYLINPLKQEESELFELNYSIINSVKRDIPIIIIYYDASGIIPIAVNVLLENIWVNSPELEVFVNLPPYYFHQALQCLCMAMMSGDSPLNIENAWMRFPIFIQLANIYFQQNMYYYAAKALRKAALISEIYENNEFYIRAEQSAYLFSKVNLYLEAAKILENIDGKKSVSFKKKYYDSLIIEANKLFNTYKYEDAAIQYENAGQWASIELEDYELYHKSLNIAMNSWISACRCDKAFKILERLPHKETKPILLEITDKIVNAINHLLSIGNLKNARDQLYYSIYTYQKEGLFEDLKKFTEKQIEVLIRIINSAIQEKDAYSAKSAYDEIENLWESYQLKKQNLDSSLEEILKLFIEIHDFSTVTSLINKLNSFEIKQKITELSIQAEEQVKESKRKDFEENVQLGLKLLQEFINYEQNILTELNTQVLKKANQYKNNMEYNNAAKIIKNQAIFLLNLGKEEIATQILIKALDMLVDTGQFILFYKYLSDIMETKRKDYLMQIYPLYIEKLKEWKEKDNFENIETIFEFSYKAYRNAMLYEQSKEISRLFIKVIKKEALRIVNTEENLDGIEKATSLIKKVNNILASYLDKEEDKVTFNKIYKKIAEIYIALEDFASARIINEKIENQAYKNEIHKTLTKLESQKSAIKSRKIEESIKEDFLKEQLSLIKKKAQDALQDRLNELKQRKALKRAYFKEALNFLKNKEYDKAIKSYKESIIRLNNIRQQYNLAGVSLAIASLLYLRENKIDQIRILLDQVNKELSSSKKFFLETFPVSLIDYILEMARIKDEPKLNEAISYLENLPLFDEEIMVLYEYLGKEFKKEDKMEASKIGPSEIAKIRSEINKIATKIEKSSQDIAKRKMMQKDYWNAALAELNRDNLTESSSIYMKSYDNLIDKKLFKHAAIGLIMSSLIHIKDKDWLSAKTNFENNLNKLRTIKEELEILPEVQLMHTLFILFENNLTDLINLIMNLFNSKLILFEPEFQFINNLLEAEIGKKGEIEHLPMKQRTESTKIKLEFEQVIGMLQQKMGDVKTENNDFIKKRTAMKRRYYEEILNLLNKGLYKEVSEKYLELSYTFAKKKDFHTSAFLVLLYGLSSLKSLEASITIKERVLKYLDSLGLSKNIVKETFYISLLLLILDCNIENLNQHDSKINSLLHVLPLFEEEKLALLNYKKY